MHNRKKPDKEASDAEKQALKDKAVMYKSLVSLLWEKRNAKDHSSETLAVLSKLLTSNPDFYSLWNFRREVLISLNSDLDKLEQGQKLDNPELREGELTVTALAIRRNPKSYGAWHHRLWVVDRLETDFTAELELCREFLKADQRNFHCWNYRRMVFEKSGLDASVEMDFCLQKIQENFSNYSAFHDRSIYIKQTKASIRDILETEWSMVENAIFTEPDDQSAWWYYQFLVTLGVNTCDGDGNLTWLLESLLKHMEVIHSLLEMEPNSRWPLMVLVFLADTLLSPPCLAGLPVALAENLQTQRAAQLKQLIEIDPIHEKRYLYLLAKSV